MWEVGSKVRVSRRKFLALCGAAAVSPALPAPLRGLETPPVANAEALLSTWPEGTEISLQDRLNRSIELVDTYMNRGLYGLPYWQDDKHVGSYAGISRSTLPILRSKKRHK